MQYPLCRPSAGGVGRGREMDEVALLTRGPNGARQTARHSGGGRRGAQPHQSRAVSGPVTAESPAQAGGPTGTRPNGRPRSLATLPKRKGTPLRATPASKRRSRAGKNSIRAGVGPGRRPTGRTGSEGRWARKPKGRWALGPGAARENRRTAAQGVGLGSLRRRAPSPSQVRLTPGPVSQLGTDGPCATRD